MSLLLSVCLSSLLAAPFDHRTPRPTTDTLARAATPHPGDKRAIKVIGQWLKQYRRGKWDVSRRQERRWLRGWPTVDITRDSLIFKHRLIPKDFNGQYITYLIEIELLCQQARELDTLAAAKAVLEVAAVGLDDVVRYRSRMVPHAVRAAGAKQLALFSAPEVHAFLLATATSTTGKGKFKLAMQAAALHCLGKLGLEQHLEVITTQLGAETAVVRAAAAHSLGQLGQPSAISALTLRLAKEADDASIDAILGAIDAIRAAKPDGVVKDHLMRMAVIEAGKALGRTASWSTDMAIVDFLEKYRFKHSVPRLIALLERYGNEPKLVESGRLAGRLRVRTHQALVSLTGSHIPMTAPTEWRSFWTRVNKTFTLAKHSNQQARSDDNTVSSGQFFDIPVEGKRIVFAIDVSGSMDFPLRGSVRGSIGAGRKQKGTTRIQVMKRELWKTISALPADSQFKVIAYNHKVTQWNKKLVYATDLQKQRLKNWLDGQKGAGGTNIYGAMTLAMQIKSLVYGNHYESSVDEVFFLSDGFPTAGEVTDTQSILDTITTLNKNAKMKINTIFLGPKKDRDYDPKGAGYQLLKDIAEQNGGKFVQPAK